MHQSYREQLGIDPTYDIKKTGDRRDVRKGQDADVESYEVFDLEGHLVAQYEILDSTSMYPPFNRTVSYRQIGDANGAGPLRPV
ncbi:hypothetical protein RugamoR64_61820 [Duganella rhizosphaerae]|uniref:hypothetical protein n=1 Tax=Duganella rhizosphaerae TaxID=2885763 RepID=UPI0030E9005F